MVCHEEVSSVKHLHFSVCFGIIGLVTILLLVCGCTPPPTSEPVSQSETSPQVIIQGDNPGKEEIQTIELDNCDGKADATRTEQRSQSVEVTISSEIAAKLGASAEVISAEVQAAVGVASSHVAGRSTSIQLVAPPRTRMIFQLVWTGKEQIGVVQNLRGSNIPIAFRSFTPTDVRIKSQSDIGCPDSAEPKQVFTPDPTAPTETQPTQPSAVQPPPTLVIPTPVPIEGVGTGVLGR